MVKVLVGTKDVRLTNASGAGRLVDGHARLLRDAARHIEELERGLMSLARLPVQAHAARLGLLHELLSRCGQGLAVELKLASALRSASMRDGKDIEAAASWELAD